MSFSLQHLYYSGCNLIQLIVHMLKLLGSIFMCGQSRQRAYLSEKAVPLVLNFSDSP